VREHLRPAAVGLALILLLVLLPFVVDPFSLYQLTFMLVFVTAILGLDVVFGRCGVLSVAQAAFVGIGAYTAAWLSAETVVSLPTELAIGGALAGLAALCIGLPALRVSGLRLAILTFAFVELFQWFLRNFPDLTGGTQGRFVAVGGIGALTTADPLVGYGFAAIVALLATLLVYRLQHGPFGRAMVAVKNSSLLAESVGVSITRTKLKAFVLSGLLGGMAGVLLAHVNGSVTPAAFDVFASLNLLVALILGGTGRLHGPWLGAAYIVTVPELFSRLGYPNLFPIASGAILMLLLVLLPGGIASALDVIAARVRRLLTLRGVATASQEGA
jgi:branched-chain amino acid transport system permease protein